MTVKERYSFVFKNPNLMGLIVFFVLIIASHSIVFQRYLINISEVERENTAELNRFVDQIQFNLNYALSATNTLAFIVENYGVPEEFDSIAKKLISANKLIEGIQLLENGIITKMYPLEGNEMLIGYNVVEDPYRANEVLMAVEKGKTYFGGPFELKQGGMGIVGRTPINVEHDSLAFAAVVILLENLIDVGADAENKDRFYYQLSKKNPDTQEVEYFFENNFDINKSQVASFRMSEGEWQIYVKEKNGNYYDGIIALSILGLFLSFSGGYITRILLKKPVELEEQVMLQSKTIIENNRRFQALVENSLDSVAILDSNASNIYVSPSISSVLGYSVEEIMKINLFEILHDDDKPFVAEEMQYVLQNPGVSIKGHISRIKHKDGSWRWIESSITNLLNDPAVKGIVDNFRDITERKKAEDQLIKEKDLSEAIINSLPGIFYLYNTKGEFKVWNKNFEEVSGYSDEEILKMTPKEFFAEEDQAYISERIAEVFEKGESFAETYFYTKSKEKIF